MKALVGAVNQEKALVGAFSAITNLRMEIFEALVAAVPFPDTLSAVAPGAWASPVTPTCTLHTSLTTAQQYGKGSIVTATTFQSIG